jgi:thymidylate synthase
MLNVLCITARDIPDAWFQAVYEIIDHGHEYVIDRGSFEGQKRLEFDYVTIQIKYPGVRPLIPDIPPALGIPNPVAEGYIEEYLPYLMTAEKNPMKIILMGNI